METYKMLCDNLNSAALNDVKYTHFRKALLLIFLQPIYEKVNLRLYLRSCFNNCTEIYIMAKYFPIFCCTNILYLCWPVITG